MRTSIRRAEVRDARRIHAALNGASLIGWRRFNGDIRIQRADFSFPRRVGGNRVGGGSLRVRSHPSDLRVRGELPDPEVSAGAEHSDAERVHLSCDAGGPPGAELGGGVQDWAGTVGRLAGAEPVVVDHRDCSVRVHREELEVQTDMAGVHVGGVFRTTRVFQAVSGFRGYAVFGDVVLSNSGSACWPASSTRIGP
ncbi:unnamed protein product [Sphenostylis stenocarpa]|uniref:Uncharacterized protein n=1 Tax=Sphenostylis stenocarpa TaxID=92480 RepID=A0AA86VDX2_9FABA|nr:unnamed protein product [Sphenostylis stenocarpa]